MKTKIVALGFFTALLAVSCSTLTPRPGPTKDTPSGGVTLSDFKLTGDLGGDVAAFMLTGNVRVENAAGGSLTLCSGPVALTSLGARQKWQMSVDQGRFVANFDRSGIYPIEVHFNAAVSQSNDWSAVDFRVAASALQPVVLQGLAADTEFQFTSAARPERRDTNFISYLPVDGAVKFAWKQSRPEAEGKLFYAAEMISQISVSPGLMRQADLINGRVMQGDLSRFALRLHGDGEVTRVQGDAVLSWNVEPVTNSTDRRLVVQFNQPQKDAFTIFAQLQTPLGAFPQAADAVQVPARSAS